MSVRSALVAVASLAIALFLVPDRAGAASPTSVPEGALDKALTCSGNLASSHREATLLVPGTMLTPETDFSWNYERAFTAEGRPWCVVSLPGAGMGDIQVAAEYVVHAIRHMHAVTGRKVQIVGHSQGGMVPRWALKYWPDTRAMVDDVIGMSPSNHGTVDANVLCVPVVGCAPAIWQQRAGSAFLTALNKGAETYAGISYTDIYTTVADEIVVPNIGPGASSMLHTGDGRIGNVAVQDVCPLHVTEHLLIGTADPVAYGLVEDALRHDGPAALARVDRSVCRQALQPGVDPGTLATDFADETASAVATLATYPHVGGEPALKAYAR